MRFIKRSQRVAPKVSLVLLDWSVRESFHLLHYLRDQSAERGSFEVVVIEYYSRVSEAVRRFEDQVDTWVVLDMPEYCYYHKHLMYNVGIALARGEIVMIGDSDAMVTRSFIGRIIDRFARTPDIVYHIDQFRNVRRDLYPFKYPTFADVTGRGCINIRDGKTTGVLDQEDPLHAPNYGACMCARRNDLLRIGGADEHIDYLGHICGPYDMTFRLVNLGRQEIWETEEFTYHTWHPGSAGEGNYLGPHDGRHMSATALEALISGRTEPLVENEAIRLLRTGEARTADEVLERLIAPAALSAWSRHALEEGRVQRSLPDRLVPIESYKGYHLVSRGSEIRAYRVVSRSSAQRYASQNLAFTGADILDVKERIDTDLSASFPEILWLSRLYATIGHIYFLVRRRALMLPGRLPVAVKVILASMLGIPAVPFIMLLFPARVATIVRNVIADSRREANSLGSLAAVIAQIKSSPENRQSAFLVVTQTAHAYAFLRLLGRFRALPPTIKVVRASTQPELEKTLGRLDGHDQKGRIILPSALFTCFHMVFLRHNLAQQMLIV